jgi:hypothetical protein
MNKYIIGLSIILLLISCSAESSNNTDVIPPLDQGSTILGTDSDADGVRDDIQTYIETAYKSEPQKNAVRQVAKVFQESLTVDTQNRTAVKDVSRKMSDAINCIYLQFNDGTDDPAIIVSRIQSMSSNTKSRLLQYLEYNKALDGSANSLPEGDTCE